jgi:hypothetical protein
MLTSIVYDQNSATNVTYEEDTVAECPSTLHSATVKKVSASWTNPCCGKKNVNYSTQNTKKKKSRKIERVDAFIDLRFTVLPNFP